MNENLPLIVEPSQLEQAITEQDPSLLIVDLSKHDNFTKAHIPGAVYLDYIELIRADKPIMGLVPFIEKLNTAFAAAGINKDKHVIAYDDEGGGKAARLLWTLDLVGHPTASMLNGGIFSWANEGHPLSHDATPPTSSQCDYSYIDKASANKEYILKRLDNKNVCFLDTRTPEEFAGIKVYAARGGHIPGAINMDWMHAIDQHNNLRLQSDSVLTELLESRGITKDKEVIAYCQTHHRSSHTYVVLKHLGYENIKGYAGAWSDWGNDSTTPIEN